MKNKNNEDRRINKLFRFIIFIFLLIGSALFIRGYFLNQTPRLVIDEIKRYNDPLELANIPTLIVNQNKNIFPADFYDFEASKLKWFVIKTEKETIINSLSENLIFTNKHFLPLNIQNVQIYSNESIFFILNAENGRGPSLIYKNANEVIEVISLEATEYFTGFYYSPSEKLFYISEGNSNEQFKIYTLNLMGQINTLYESSDKLEIIKARQEDLILKVDSKCNTLTYATKLLKQIDCSQVFKPTESIDLTTVPEGIVKSAFKLSDKVLVINQYFGLERLLVESGQSPVSYISYPKNYWSEISFTQDKVFSINFLNNYYLVQ